VPLGNYYARLPVKGKLIRKRLRMELLTSDQEVAVLMQKITARMLAPKLVQFPPEVNRSKIQIGLANRSPHPTCANHPAFAQNDVWHPR
jgi:hypothetical protein